MQNVRRKIGIWAAGLLLASAAGAQDRYVWSGVRIEGGQRSGKAVSAMSDAEIRKAKRAGTDDALLQELAEIRLLADVDRKLEEASKRLDDLRIRAAWALDYEGRREVLVQVAKARAEVLAKLGKRDEAAQAVVQLLPYAAAKAAAPGYELVPADAAALADEKAGAQDARLASVDASAPPASQDEIEAVVTRAFQMQQVQLVLDIGPRAVPAIEKIILAEIDLLPANRAYDPLSFLLKLARMRAAQFVLDHYDRGGFFWKKRILRSMADCKVFESGPLEPAWLLALAKLIRDPQVGREAIALVNPVAQRNALTPELQAALGRALDIDDPDVARDVVDALDGTKGESTLQPLIEKMLRHRLDFVRQVAAQQIIYFSSSEVAPQSADHPDPIVRAAVARFLGGRLMRKDPARRPEDSETFLRLAQDADPQVRECAARFLAEFDPALDIKFYERLASDPDPTVLVTVDRALVKIAGDQRSTEPWFLAMLVARRANRTIPLGAKEVDPTQSPWLYERLLRTDPGVREIFDWALRDGDDRLLALAVDKLPVDPPGKSDERGGVAALDDATLEKVYRRIFATSAKDFDRLQRGLVNDRWRNQARVGAMLPIVRDTSAPRALRLQAATVAVIAPTDEVVSAIASLISDPVWTREELTETESAWFIAIGRFLRTKGSEIARRAVESKSITDAVALSFLAGIWNSNDRSDSLARLVLDRWFVAAQAVVTGDKRSTDLMDIVNRALLRIPAEHDEKLSRYLLEGLAGPFQGAALEKMGELRWPEFIDPVGALVRKGNHRAAQVIGGFMSDKAVEYLLEGMSASGDEEFRSLCLKQLEAIRKYQDEKARWSTRKGGEQARDDAVAQLLPMLADADEKIRAQAALSLATLDAVEHLPKLVGLLRDKSPAVRAAAQQAIDKLNASGARKP